MSLEGTFFLRNDPCFLGIFFRSFDWIYWTAIQPRRWWSSRVLAHQTTSVVASFVLIARVFFVQSSFPLKWWGWFFAIHFKIWSSQIGSSSQVGFTLMLETTAWVSDGVASSLRHFVKSTESQNRTQKSSMSLTHHHLMHLYIEILAFQSIRHNCHSFFPNKIGIFFEARDNTPPKTKECPLKSDHSKHESFSQQWFYVCFPGRNPSKFPYVVHFFFSQKNG